MTLKALARNAHQSLQAHAGCNIRHSHVHELLAAAFGYKTWAALSAEALLADAGVGQAVPALPAPRIAGRALQLLYGQAAAAAMAGALGDLIAEQKLGLVSWSSLAPLMESDAVTETATQGDEDWDGEDWDEPVSPPTPTATPPRELLLTSKLLLDSLLVAAAKQPHAHQVLAGLYRCGKPNPYLYEESLKGRALTSVERGWVEEYLRDAPRYERYEAHLKAAAEAGVRAAALEYGTVFGRPEFLALAERLDGPVNPEEMARVAPSLEARCRWLRQAAEAGSYRALEDLADLGDQWAESQMAATASAHWLRDAAERALAENDPVRAWAFQYVALARDEDLTRSTMVARHDGGSNDGEFYDSDFGGPLYVDGDEGLTLPDLDDARHREAKQQAEILLHG